MTAETRTENPVELAAQMAAIADRLRESLIDNEDWDYDWAAVTASAKETVENLTGVASLILDFANASDEPAWVGDVYEAAEETTTQLVRALTAVDDLADAVANAQGDQAAADETEAQDVDDAEPAPPVRGDLVWYEDEPHVVEHVSTSGYLGLVAGDDPDAAARSHKRCAARVDEVTARL